MPVPKIATLVIPSASVKHPHNLTGRILDGNLVLMAQTGPALVRAAPLPVNIGKHHTLRNVINPVADRKVERLHTRLPVGHQTPITRLKLAAENTIVSRFNDGGYISDLAVSAPRRIDPPSLVDGVPMDIFRPLLHDECRAWRVAHLAPFGSAGQISHMIHPDRIILRNRRERGHRNHHENLARHCLHLIEHQVFTIRPATFHTANSLMTGIAAVFVAVKRTFDTTAGSNICMRLCPTLVPEQRIFHPSPGTRPSTL